MTVTTIQLQPDIENDRQSLEQKRWDETLQAMESVALCLAVEEGPVHAWLQSWGSDREFSPPDAGK